MRWNAFALVSAVVAVLVFGVGSASAQGQFHGIAFTKGCTQTVNVGSPYTCAYRIFNVVDQGHDTVQISQIVDVVHAASGDVSSGNILGSLQLVFSSPTVTCSGGSGAGTSTSPYVGATSCLLPFGTNVTASGTPFYTVQPGDFALPNHSLTDTATLTWNNTCTAPGVLNCSTGPQTPTSGGASTVQLLAASVTTQIHNAAHQVVTAIGVGGTVHDFVSVTGAPGTPTPTGNVSIDWFTNGTCSGTPAANSGSIGPLANGQFDATAFAFPVNTPGGRSFLAHYLGDASNPPATGMCEPLQVVDANIQITPATAANEVGTPHTLTGHVNVNSGGGFVNAPDGTVITFSIVSGPGSVVGSPNCTTSGGTGSCTAVISSSMPGVTMVKAATTVTVSGVSLHRETGDANAGDSPNAQKNWVDANIQITPAQATNPVGTLHTLTGHVNVNSGGGFVNAPDGTVINFTIVSGPGSFVGPMSCTTSGGTGSCTAVITSTTNGTTVVRATTTVSVGGVSLTRASNDGKAGDSSDAQKTWQTTDANIQITPQTATNPVGSTHTLTGHVNVNTGGGFVNAPDGTTINFSIVSGPGSFSGPASCATTGGTGSCTVVITSSTAGTTTVKASTDVNVGGVVLHRETGDANTGDSPNATKNWTNLGPCTLGYPDASNNPRSSVVFNESTVLVSAGLFGTGSQMHVGVFTDDEHALTLGVNPGVTPYPGSVPNGGVSPVGIGVLTAADPFGRPIFPAMFITDITANPNSRAGDWQQQSTNSTAVGPTRIFGTWKSATQSGTTITPGPDPAKNNWNLGTGADPAPTTSTQGYNSEVVWSINQLGLQPGHAYRLQVMVHDGDQNKTGGDVGESCVNVIVPSGPVPPDANIQVTPSTATNLVGTTHTLTGHVNVNPGSGYVNAPDGQQINFTILSGPGTFSGPSTCMTSGGSGSCTVVITSQTAGTTVVRAAADVTVNGSLLHRATGDSNFGDSPDASKTWQALGPCVLGYPDSSHTPRSSAAFNESTVLVSAALYGSGANQRIGVFTDDEHALTLGVNPGVTAFPGIVPNGGQFPVSVGNLLASDPFGRPIFPAMFVTDITTSLSSRVGDWQQLNDNSTALPPSGIFGTWKSATQSGTSITPGPDPAKNNWNLGTGADPAPNTKSQGYNSEVVWNTSAIGLQSGHIYRLQVMVHDGDQNQTGGDVGEACVNVRVP